MFRKIDSIVLKMATSSTSDDQSAMATSRDTSGDAVAAAASWESETEARVEAHELLLMFVVPHVLNAVHKLNIFEALAAKGEGASLTARELADLAMSHPNSGIDPGKPLNVNYLERMFRCLTTAKVFRETVTVTTQNGPPERRYALTPLSRLFVKNGDGVSMAALLALLMDPVFLAPWGHLHEAVADTTVSPFKRAHGVDAWDYGKQDERFDGLFNAGMYNHARVCMRAVVEQYRGFEGLGVLVDVGGGFGSSLALISEKYPNIKCINFDQPHVIAKCKEVKGVEFVGGDMFDSVPSGDAIFMKWILHDWDDESNLKLLKNCYKALPVGGKVIVMDGILPEIIDHKKIQHHVPFEWDMQMLAYNSSGARERTEREVRDLGLAAGFARVEVIMAVDPFGIIEMHKD